MLDCRRWCTIALVLGLSLLAATGCRKKSSRRSTNISGADIFTTDTFPGAEVQDGNVADDKRAFSISGEDFVAGSLQVTQNGDRGTAMATYRTNGSGLWASHFDGRWTPPVKLQALDGPGMPSVPTADLVVHAFLNTDGAADGNAEARDGDCLILWRNDDIDLDGAGTADGVNTGLFVTYFDASEREEISARYGFQEWAQRIDGQDEVDEDVTTFGIATDGLCGEARWVNDGGGFATGRSSGAYVYGDATTAIEVFFRQTENNDADVAIEDVNYYSVRFNPAEVLDETIPLTPSAATRLGVNTFGASNSGTDSQETLCSTKAITYNNLLFTHQAADDSGVAMSDGYYYAGSTINADNDVTIQYYQFDLASGGIAGPTHLHPVTPDATDTVENGAVFLTRFNDDLALGGGTLWGGLAANSVYGSDEGLACAVIFYGVLVEDADGEVDFGDLTNNERLMIAQILESTGALVEMAQINGDDPDIIDSLPPTAYLTVDNDLRLSRNGDSIWITWGQVTDQTVDEIDLYAAQYITTRPDDDGLFVIPPLAATLSSPLNLSPDTDDSISWHRIQDCLGYVCGAQSDPDLMYVYWEESAGGPDDVYEAVLRADLVTPCSPLSSTTLFFPFDNNGDQPNSGSSFGFNNGALFNAADAGHEGEILVVYREDYDATAGGVDYRLTADVSGAGGGLVELSSGTSLKEVTAIDRILCTPPGEEIGVFDVVDLEDQDERSHGAQEVHIFFRESESHQSSGLGQALRTRVYRTDHDDDTFGEQFTPSALSSAFYLPFDLDLPDSDPAAGTDATVVGVGIDGDRVGVWFTELSRVYYQEYDADASGDVQWLNDDEASAPILVDDDNDEEIQAFALFRRRACTCDTLSGAMVFWTKAYGSGSGGGLSERLQVRVRD